MLRAQAYDAGCHARFADCAVNHFFHYDSILYIVFSVN
jgi:hypothetical protein